MIPSFRGSIELFSQKPGSRGVRSKLGYSPENAYFSNFLTPLEVLSSMGTLSSMSHQELRETSIYWLERMKLDGVANQSVKTFSKGMKQRLNLIQCLIHDPQFVILDEPTTGLDPIGKKEVKNLILELKEKGKTVLVCTHNLLEAQEFCDRICIINQGYLVKEGILDEVLIDGKNLEESFIAHVSQGAVQ